MKAIFLLLVTALLLARPATEAAWIDGSAPGQVDVSFDHESAHGPNGTVRALAVQADGRVLVGGYFTKIGRASCRERV